MNSNPEHKTESTVSIKRGAQICRIREQTIHDPDSGLSFQFEIDDEGRTRFRVFGDAIPAENWEIHFEYGWVSYTGTAEIPADQHNHPRM
jgi:hypothetical protein